MVSQTTMLVLAPLLLVQLTQKVTVSPRVAVARFEVFTKGIDGVKVEVIAGTGELVTLNVGVTLGVTEGVMVLVLVIVMVRVKVGLPAAVLGVGVGVGVSHDTSCTSCRLLEPPVPEVKPQKTQVWPAKMVLMMFAV